MRIFNLRERDIEKVLELGDLVYGDNYNSRDYYLGSLEKSMRNGISCSFVAYDDLTEDLIGFRITYAPGNWEFDEGCEPDLWGVPPEKVCYFQVNTIHPGRQRQGMGSIMLAHSIEAVKLQGGVAGVAHIWMDSPGNSAFKYFSKAGGQVVKIHPDHWHDIFKANGTICSLDGQDCHCDGAEMIIHFSEGEEDV